MVIVTPRMDGGLCGDRDGDVVRMEALRRVVVMVNVVMMLLEV